jgi:hypothetical protein
MSENPHRYWIPGVPFTVRTEKASIINERGLRPDRKLTVSFTANLSCWPAIGFDSCRDVFLLKSTRYGDFLIAGDSLRGTRFHSHSIVNKRAVFIGEAWRFCTANSPDTDIPTVAATTMKAIFLMTTGDEAYTLLVFEGPSAACWLR